MHKLQETRAFVGFSRAEPKELPISERKKMLRIGDDNWLPAIRVQGEGIFFEFNKSEVENWAKQPAVVAALLFRRPRRFSADITQTEKHTVCQSKRSRVFI